MAATFYGNQDAVKALVDGGSDVRRAVTLEGFFQGRDLSFNSAEIAIGLRVCACGPRGGPPWPLRPLRAPRRGSDHGGGG